MMMTTDSHRSKAWRFFVFELDKKGWSGDQFEGLVVGFLDTLAWGTRILVPHCLQRTVLPRATSGTDRTFRHVRFGHIIRSICSDIVFWPPVD